MFMAVFLVIILYYAKNKLFLTSRQWDLDTITAGDYTVEYRVHSAEFDEFKFNYNQNDFNSLNYKYMEHIKEKFEDLVSKQPAVNEETDTIKISSISFGFKNHKMIDLLTKRGQAIVRYDMKEKRLIEEEIEDLKKTSIEELSRPVIAYVTFETQEGYERAIRIGSGFGYMFSPAVEPTNIIWENSHYSMSVILSRSMVAISVIAGLLVGAFFILLFIKWSLVWSNVKYMNLNCNEFNTHFETKGSLLEHALIDYYGYYYSNTSTMMTGSLQ